MKRIYETPILDVKNLADEDVVRCSNKVYDESQNEKDGTIFSPFGNFNG